MSRPTRASRNWRSRNVLAERLLPRLAILPLLWLCSASAALFAADAVDYGMYREVRDLYDQGMASDDCQAVRARSEALRAFLRSREPIPPELAAELQTSRADVGVYVRHLRRQLNQRAKDLCPVVPAPCEEAPGQMDAAALEEFYALALDSQYCSLVLNMAQQMIGESGPGLAPRALELLIKLQAKRPECFAP